MLSRNVVVDQVCRHPGIVALRGLALLASVCLMSACGESSDGGTQSLVLKAAHSTTVEEPYHKGLLEMARIVSERTGGRVQIEIFPSMQLGSERAMIEGLLLGTIDLVVTANGTVTNFAPEMGILDLPFLFRDRDHLYAVIDGPVGEQLATSLASRGFRLLSFYEAGVRHIMTADKPINSMQDLAGLKIRTMPVPAHIASFNAYGAQAVAVDYGELYGGLQTGVIDGAEAANTNYHNKRFYEVAPHWAQLGWVTLAAPLMMSEKRYSSLPPDVQQVIAEAARESALLERRLYAESDDGLLAVLEGKGVEVTYPDPAPFRDASRAVYDEFVKTESERALLDAILE